MSVLSSTSNKDAALALASRGLRVFPCNPNKKPKVKTWEQAASASPFEIAVKWEGSPDLLPGLPVGAHGLLVIDTDRKPNGPDGVAAFTELCSAERIDLSTTMVVETPSGGFHFYFRTDTPYGNSPGSLPDGVDVRGLGGFVIVPGATLPDGRGYRIVQGTWDGIAPLPEALANYLRPKDAIASQTIHKPQIVTEPTDREKEYAAAALEDELVKLARMKPGMGRNNALNASSHSLGTMIGAGWLDVQATAHALLDAARCNGHVAKHGETQTCKTIESGINAGMLKPRSPLPIDDISDEYIAQTQTGLLAQFKTKQTDKTAPQSNGKRSVKLSQISAIEAKPITWLWRGYLPKGKLTLLAGAGGTGKSTIAFNFAGIISNGGIWPDGTRCNEAGNVIIWSSEDDPADTIKPRLMAVGANQNRCGIITGTVDENGISCPFDAAIDMGRLREAVEAIGGISLLIIDPIVTAVVGDMHKANDVRRSLQTIVDFASEMDCAVLGITHFAKGTAGKNSAERVIGSTAFKDFARMVLAAAKEEESDRRVFTRAKSNNSVDTGGFSYTIEALVLNQNIEATRVVWGEALEGSSRSILAEIEGDGINDDTSKIGQAKRFLLEALASGPVGSKELMKHARERYGLSEKTLRRAQTNLGIEATHNPVFAGGWSWSLPPHPPA